MATLLFDLRSAVRALARRPGFAAVTVLTLALGLGANTAIFSVVRGVLLRPLPFPEPERLVAVWSSGPETGPATMYASPPDFVDWRAVSEELSSLAAFDRENLLLAPAAGGAERAPTEVKAARVTASFFDTLGVRPRVGRTFTPGEDRAEGEPAAILSHRLWRERFDGNGGGDESVLGRKVELDGAEHRVVGVMPPGFSFPPPFELEGTVAAEPVELWVPFAADLAGAQRGARYLSVIGRLVPGASAERAQAELTAVAGALAEEYPGSNAKWTEVRVVPLREQLFGAIAPTLWLLLGAVGFVLLIACVNIANLLLSLAADRRRELAVRRALGASRGRLARQVLTESLLLAAAGAVAGLLFAIWGLELLLALAPAEVPGLERVGLDGAVLAFTAALALLTGLAFGALPALGVAGGGGRLGGPTATVGRGRNRLGAVLVAAEVALALILLVGAGLLLRSFLELRGVDPGFRAESVLTARVTLPREGYDDWSSEEDRSARVRTFDLLEREARALPGVAAAGFVYELPLATDRQGTRVVLPGRESEPDALTNFTSATPGYFEAMGIRVLEGRGISARDRADAEPVVVVNRTFAELYFGGRRAVGRTMQLASNPVDRRVVGVVEDVLHDTLDREAFPGVYLPYAQLPWPRALSLAARLEQESGGPAPVLAALSERLGRAAPGVAVHRGRTMEEVVGASLAQPRFLSLLTAAFAAVALLLAAVGVYGVLAYAVGRRTREIGVRMALGAARRDVLRLVLGRGLAPVAAGLVAGLAGALALAGVLERFLFRVSAIDPGVYVGLPLFLLAVAVVACLVPTRRALAVDPKRSLEAE